MFTGSATGDLLPACVVYKSTHLYDTWTQHGPNGTIYNRSPSGWFDGKLFKDFFFHIVMPYFKQSPVDEPKIMIGNNCASLIICSYTSLCRKQHTIRFPAPNSTHMSQPLDVA